MLLHTYLEQSAARTPHATALIHRGTSTSYGELEVMANRVAHALIASGIRRGDRVAILLDNTPSWVAAYLGTMKAGAAAVPLNPAARARELGRMLADARPGAVIAGPEARGLEGGLAEIGGVPVSLTLEGYLEGNPAAGIIVSLAATLEAGPEEPPEIRLEEGDPAAIIYTSGSTGEPRGVVLAHRNIVSNTESIVAYLDLTERDRVMAVLPFYYCYGASLLHTHLKVGGSVVIENRFRYPAKVVQELAGQHCTGFAGVPSTFAILLDNSPLARTDLPDLRYVTQAGGPMPSERIRELQQALPRTQVYIMYGQTEASARLSYLPPERLVDKLGSIGRGIPDVTLTVVDEQGNELAAGEVGELVARGPNIMLGYWGRPEETARVLTPYGLLTGDMARKDEDGFIFLVGRKRDMIKVGAFRVGPREIEEVIMEHPAVAEVAVVGMPHHLLGEQPIAFVRLRDGVAVEASALRAHCRTRLTPVKVPGSIVIRRVLPRNAAGKIALAELREEAQRIAEAAAMGMRRREE